MTDDQHGEGTPPQGAHGGWERLPQGDYDDGATTFVQLPEGGIDALLAANSPLAAPGQGYVPPPITVTPATTAGTDPSATGTWTVPAEGAQWPDPNAVPQGTGGHEHEYGYQPGGAGQWNYGETGQYGGDGQYGENGSYEETGQEGPEAPGHDVTGQWSIPVAGGELPDESGEFTQSSLVEQWGGTPPATLPGGAPAPWATEAIGTAWTAPPPEPAGERPGYPGGAPDAYAPGVPEEAPREPSAEPYAHAPAEMPGEAPEGAQEAAEGSATASGPAAAAEHPRVPDVTETLKFPQVRIGGSPDDPEALAAMRAAHAPEAPEPSTAPDAPGAPVGAEDTGTADGADAAEEPVTEPGTDDDPATTATEAEPAAAEVPDTLDAPDDADAADASVVPVDGTEDAAAEQPAAPHEDHPLASYVLRVNGTDRPVADAWIGESLLYVLRERLGLAGAKDGCSQGECGACNVQVEGRLVASCLVPAVTAAGSEVRTVEGLAEGGQPSDVQRALATCGAVQCGFCVPGMAMTVHDLLERNPAPTELETRAALCGNLCRCSGYRGVLEAVREVVAEREAHTADGPGVAQDTGEARIPHQAGPGAGGVNPAAYEDASGYEDPSRYDPQGQPPEPPAQHDQSYGPDGGSQA
ncbi:2Fe-2S iron-sulfur cluster-binding protein [Streptomyces sp. CRN 30]|uniref:2Fe-2S iron-sulfur cluster-binding protein n=1 Tax=Streptomyces sp. CRN 30 TaxID=3075613 RepID=UPI002A829562|nr:2Fe-2S iron-sulfur cluster-binding protein [Streptomyces sp. CRN 30]